MWARLPVLCFLLGLRGPSDEAWAWSRAFFVAGSKKEYS
jgi:hypothetical protein